MRMKTIAALLLLLLITTTAAQAQFFRPGGGYWPQPYYCGIACPKQQPAAVQTKRKRAVRPGTEQPERKPRGRQ
jgi:hypothetical protein